MDANTIDEILIEKILDLTGDNQRVATCIGCKCDDYNACVNEYHEPCHWLVVDYKKGIGVCSCCPESLKDWEK